MCEQCRSRLYPCPCVDAPPEVKCPLCGERIREGEEYIIILESRHHLDCVTSMPAIDQMELLGVEIQTSLEVEGE